MASETGKKKAVKKKAAPKKAAVKKAATKKAAPKHSGKRTFKDWYEENKKKLNAQKKVRYEKDPNYRDAARERVRQKYMEENNIFEDGSRIVHLDGVAHVAYKLSDAADMVEVNINTLRGYFQRGYLPLIHFDDTRLKLITVDQFKLLQRFVDATETMSPMEAHKKHGAYIKKHWRNNNGSKKIISKANKKG